MFMKGLHFVPMEEHLRHKKILVYLWFIFYLFTDANIKFDCYSGKVRNVSEW